MESRWLHVLLAAVLWLNGGADAQTRGGQGTMKEITDTVLMDYDRSTNPSLAVAQEAPSPPGECPQVDVNMIDAQIYVTKIPDIDQKTGTYSLEGFFRLWWNDPRLTFDDSDNGGCVEKLVFLDGATTLWTPDFYFPPAVSHTIGARGDGQLMEVKPSGEVYWSQRLRMTVNCEMDFRQMPWDTQECNIVMGSYSQGPSEVSFQWKPGRIAMEKLEEMTNNEWEIGAQEQGEVREAGLNPKVQVKFTLTRVPDPHVQSMAQSVLFVAVSYLGCWIAKGAVPARVTLAIVTILVVSNTQVALKAQLPKIHYSVWLLDFQSGCLVFNVVSFILYVLVNFGSQQKDSFDKTWKFDEETGKWKSLKKAKTDGSRSLSAGMVASTEGRSSTLPKSKQEAIQQQIQELRAGKVPAVAADDQDVERQAATGDASRSKEEIQQRIEEVRAGKAIADTERQSLTAATAPVPDADTEDQPSTVLVWSTKMASIDEVTRWAFPLVFALFVMIKLAQWPAYKNSG